MIAAAAAVAATLFFRRQAGTIKPIRCVERGWWIMCCSRSRTKTFCWKIAHSCAICLVDDDEQWTSGEFIHSVSARWMHSMEVILLLFGPWHEWIAAQSISQKITWIWCGVRTVYACDRVGRQVYGRPSKMFDGFLTLLRWRCCRCYCDFHCPIWS